MAPPAKRRKRNIVEDSDDDGDDNRKAPRPTNNTLTRYLLSSPDAKRSPVKNSDDIGNDEPPSPSPARKVTTRASGTKSAAAPAPPLSLSARNRGSKTTNAKTKSPSTSPDKTRAKGIVKKGKAAEEKGRSADLVTLFSRQSQRNQISGVLNGGVKKDLVKQQVVLDDIISDPISEDNEEILPSRAAGTSVVGKNAQKRAAGGQFGFGAPSSTANSSSSRFLRPPNSSQSVPVSSTQTRTTAVPADDGGDFRPWSERFAPANLDELAVHKKKVADVRRWLDDVFANRVRQRLLILKGAAGTAKTTTVQLLARDMHVELLEWRNPANIMGATQGYQSASAQFEEFLGRGGKFGQLDVDSEQEPSVAPAAFNDHETGAERRMILIEEFPNTFMRSSSALRSFRNTILQFLAANTPSLSTFAYHSADERVIPIVMIISETLLTTTSASADSFTAHRLLGPEILRHPGAAVIEFNPIAPTFLAKALELVVQKEARISGRRRTPGPLVLQRLGEIGDIRSAISSLEFLCVKGDNDTDWGAKVAFSKPKRGKDAPAMTRSEQDSLELISQREASLGIFHAVGKVVYNKREEKPYPAGSVEAQAETLPAYMAHLARTKRSQVAVDTLIDETGTDTHTFISALHENYALSCEDPDHSLDYLNNCIEFLSESDLLCPSRDIFFGGKGFGGAYMGKDSGSHIMRQDEMAFQVAVRGLLFSLPSPVKRQTHPGAKGKGGDTFKMFFPSSLKLWRAKEELEGLIDLLATKMLKGEDGGPGPPGGGNGPGAGNVGPALFRKPGGVASGAFGAGSSASSQKSLGFSSTQSARLDASKRPLETPSPPPLLSLGTSARRELLLERLPYMAHIARRKRSSFGTMRLRDLEKIVTFQGIGPPKTDESDDADDDDSGTATGGEAWATDKPSEEPSPRKKGLGAILSRSRVRDGAAGGGNSGSGSGNGGGSGIFGDEGGSFMGGPSVQGLVLSDDDIEDD